MNWSGLWASTKEFARPYIAPFLVAIVILLFLQTSSLHIAHWAQHRGEEWTWTLQTNLAQADSLKDSFGQTFSGTEKEKDRLEAQFQELRARCRHHLTVMTEFYGWYYMAIIMMSLTAAIAAMILLWISKKGWSDATPAVLIAFVIMATATIYYREFPGVFKQEENIAENKRLYLAYVVLQNEMRSYCVTGEDLNGKKQPAAKFIHYLGAC